MAISIFRIAFSVVDTAIFIFRIAFSVVDTAIFIFRIAFFIVDIAFVSDVLGFVKYVMPFWNYQQAI